MGETPSAANRGLPQVGLLSGVALSLSGMMGSGLFSILGHAYLADGTNFPIAFMFASVAILFSVYAVAKLAATLVVLCGLVNLLGANRVGRVASVLIALVFCALLWFSAIGIAQVHPVLPSLSGVSWQGVLVATAMLYINFQGFGMVVSASQSMADPAKTVPRAMFIAIGVISALYFIVSWVAIQVTPPDVLAANAGNLLGAAAEIIAGSVGAKVIAMAALLACAAAVNASIFTASRILTSVVSDHPASNRMRLALGTQPQRPILISAAIVILLILYFPLVAVGKMASMAWVLWLGALVNLSLFTFLLVDGLRFAPETIGFLLVALGGTLLAETRYRLHTQQP